MFNYLHVEKKVKIQDLHKIKGGIPDIPMTLYWLLTHVSDCFSQ